MEVHFKVRKDFVCIFTCLLMESMDGGVLISPDCARLIVDLSDALEGGAGALAGKYSYFFCWQRWRDKSMRKVYAVDRTTGIVKGREPACCVLDFNR